ncbi:MAG: hypothetical protein NXI00_19535 [Cytophagales bacterium]|nr:hypothetical protein [Cytophagales bacterium]
MDNLFIKSEIWQLTIHGAYQRVKIFKDEHSAGVIKVFEDALRLEVLSLAEDQYKVTVSSEDHLENIQLLASYFQESEMLHEKVPAFAFAQKFLNLFLKNLWCLGEIAEPPHFPIDRSLQRFLGIASQDILSWTQIDTPEKYMYIINRAKAMKGETTLADFELRLYNEKRLVA